MRQIKNKFKLNPEAPSFVPRNTVLTTAQIRRQPKIKPSISKVMEDKKHVRWCPQLAQTHRIEASGYQSSTKYIKEETHNWTAQRDRDTNRSKRHRDQVTDVVVTMCQLDAWNNNKFPACPSPTTLFKEQWSTHNNYFPP